MSDENIAVKDILTVAAPFIKSVVDTFVTPKLENLKQKISIDISQYHIPTEEHFREYFYRTYRKLSFINTLVFNNSQKLLKEIYQPLTLSSPYGGNVRHKIDAYPEMIISEFQRILITDTAGMGKSTLMKRIFLDIIDAKKGIPLLIELRRLSKAKSILDEIHEQLNAVNKEFDKDLMLELINEGEFIFILDGYDEVSLSEREVVTKDIQTFISKASINKFFLTSRPESALKSFGDFAEYRIEPLKKKEAFDLLRKYDNNGSISSLLIKRLQEIDLKSIEEFLINPLLVSLLFTAFEYKQVIPFKKHIFYRQVYDANFEMHDLTKGESYMHDKYCGLDIDDFHRILRYIGYECLKFQKIEFTKDELLHVINDSKDFCIGLNFTSSDFIKDIIATVPLFTQDGIYYRWSHKSLQEYFAAQFIYLDAKNKQSQILDRIYNSSSLDNFINLLDIYYDIDFRTFRNVIIKQLIDEYIYYTDSHYKNEYIDIPKKSLDERITNTFFRDFFVIIGGYGDPIIKINSKYEFNAGSYDSVILKIPTKENNCIGVVFHSKKIDVLSILYGKRNELILEKISNMLRYNEEDIKNYLHDIRDSNCICRLDDNPANQLNNSDNFNITTFFLRAHFYTYSISYDVAIKVRNEIIQNMEREKQEDFLLTGI